MSAYFSINGEDVKVVDIMEGVGRGELVQHLHTTPNKLCVGVATETDCGSWVWLDVEDTDVVGATTYCGNNEEPFDLWLQEIVGAYLVYEG